MPVTATFHHPPVLQQRREALDAWGEYPSGEPQPAVYVGVNRMLLYEGAELDSEVMGVLPFGALIYVQDSCTLKDGTRRRRVMTDQRHLQQGWLSLLSKNGRNNLECFCPGATRLLHTGKINDVFDHRAPAIWTEHDSSGEASIAAEDVVAAPAECGASNSASPVEMPLLSVEEKPDTIETDEEPAPSRKRRRD